MAKRIISLKLGVLILALAASPISIAQSRSQSSADDSRPRTVAQKVNQNPVTDTRPLNTAEPTEVENEAAIQTQINAVYRSFYNSYRLGPGDVIAIYIDKHPEDSVQRVNVSAVGRIYFPLLGDVSVVGRTLPQLQDYFTNAVAEFIREPRLTL